MGDLERRIMDLLWDARGTLSAQELRDLLDPAGAAGEHKPMPALTTVLTVLSRLEKKGFVSRERAHRPHRYAPVSSRAEHMASLMHDVLSASGEREAVLARFVSQVDTAEAETLRKLLAP